MPTTRKMPKPVGSGTKAGASSPPATHPASAQARRSTTHSSSADHARSAGRSGAKPEKWGRGHTATTRVTAAAAAPVKPAATRSPAPQRAYDLTTFDLAPDPGPQVNVANVMAPVTRAVTPINPPATAPQVVAAPTAATVPPVASGTSSTEAAASQGPSATTQAGWWGRLSPMAKVVAIFTISQVAGWLIGAAVNRWVLLTYPPPPSGVRILAPETSQLPVANQTCEQCPHTTAKTHPAS